MEGEGRTGRYGRGDKKHTVEAVGCLKCGNHRWNEDPSESRSFPGWRAGSDWLWGIFLRRPLSLRRSCTAPQRSQESRGKARTDHDPR